MNDSARRKRIAVFMADCQSDYGRKTMEGIIKQAHALNYDILTFSFFSNHDMIHPLQIGEENIISLFNPKEADGIISFKQTFHKPSIREHIEQICESSGLPFVEFEDFDVEDRFGVWKDRELFCRLTDHMIEEHSKKKIYCLTGTADSHQSLMRLEGYRDSMRAHGFFFDESYEFFGDFWRTYAQQLAEDIANGVVEKPEAVVCANGVMAINLTISLLTNGISVPDEVAVAGYDSYYQNILCTPTITTISNINYNQGVNIVRRLHAEITGEICQTDLLIEEKIEKGQSCGCSDRESELLQWYKQDLSDQLYFTDLLESSNMLQQISVAENINCFAATLIRLIYLIRGIKNINLCICDDWDGINNNESDSYRTEGYSENMIMYALDPDANIIHFNSKDMLPLIGSGESPNAYYFIPLHFEDRCFGYIAAEFDDVQFSYDKQFWIWVDNVGTAIEALRIRNYIRRFSERKHLTAIRDPLTGLYNRRGFEELSAEFFEQSLNNREKFLLIAFEVVNFRAITKELGYRFGDGVTVTIAEAINNTCLGNEICCRYSEDKFYLIGSATYPRDTAVTHIGKVLSYCKKNITETELELECAFFYDKVQDVSALSDIISSLDEEIEKKKTKMLGKNGCIKSFSQLRRHIYSHPERKWNIDNMAQMMLLSRAYFQRLYKKEFGVSVMTDVISARIGLAKYMLVNDERSIGEISAACGYDSEVYFMQQFKKMVGITPTQYRKDQELNS